MQISNDEQIVEGILNALPAQIALVEVGGVIVRVNEAWLNFGTENGSAHGSLGLDYLAICDAATGEDASDARIAAAGIRAVMRSEIDQFVSEYPCHSPNKERWFQMRVTPYAGRGAAGAVVMHTEITERRVLENALRESEARVKRLNRVHAVLSGAHTLIVQARSREWLFRDACRIAVEEGGFRMSMILMVDPDSGILSPAASSGMHDDHRRIVTSILASAGGSLAMAPRALADRRAIVSNDVLNDRTLRLGEDYAVQGVRSLAVLPLVVEGRSLGVLVLYAAEKDFFHDAEMKLLGQLGDEIAFAVDHIEKVERIEYLARFDDCTGLANRGLFVARVAERLLSARRAGSSHCVMIFDLERFKSINDTFGRDAGDSLLRQVADWLRRHTGDETRVARIGPDQFAAVTRAFDGRDEVISHLDADISAFMGHPFRINEGVFRVAIKLGVVISPDDGEDAETLLKHAEVALKQAKRTGARRVFHDHRMSAALAGQLTLETQMRRALEDGEFVLHYQPKVSLATGDLTGVEALIRWNDPRGGLTLPGRFIPILEESGLIQEVGRWVLRTAVDEHLRWRAAGLPAVRISVNVSPLQLRGPDFLAEVQGIVGVDPAAAAGLALEITESLIVENIRNSIDSLQAIRETGVTVAIDDFGTGFSSLSYLARLPVDALKIDQSFIADMASGRKGLSLVSTIIDLGHSLELVVVAEGVETEEQARLLRRLDCDEMQGFLTDKALPAAAFETKYLCPRRRAAAEG